MYPFAVPTPSYWDCPEFRDRHLDLTDGALAAADEAAALAHLEACMDCACFDVRVRRAMLVVRNLPPVPASPDLYRRIMARVRESAALAFIGDATASAESERLVAMLPAS